MHLSMYDTTYQFGRLTRDIQGWQVYLKAPITENYLVSRSRDKIIFFVVTYKLFYELKVKSNFSYFPHLCTQTCISDVHLVRASQTCTFRRARLLT